MRNVKIGRRAFVRSGLMAGVLPIGSWAAAKDRSQPTIEGSQTRLHRLLVDRTIAESARLGTYSSPIADEVFEFDGDVTRLWNDELRLQWSNGPRPIAGMTSPSVLMVLEQLGRDHDARIVFKAEHQKVGGLMQHRVLGCEQHIRSTTVRRRGDWVCDMARLIAACPHNTSLRLAPFEYDSAPGPDLPSTSQRLVTWVLAPVLRPDTPIKSATVS